MKNTFLIGLVTLLFSCNSIENNKKITSTNLSSTIWRATLSIQKQELPFHFKITKTENTNYVEFINDSEILRVDNVNITNDSIIIPGYIFESEIRAKIMDSNHIKGVYKRLDTKDIYEIPFEAFANQPYRFKKEVLPQTFNYTGKWEVTFVHNNEDTTKAIGIFNQEENKISGTFITSTGDYRYLEGQIDDDKLMLSCFDGTHLFLFNAAPINNQKIQGKFYSGKTWEESWVAIRNNDFELPDPTTLTFLKEGYEELAFSFPDIESKKIISLSDNRFKNKVTIVQIMGSWCPNCMDETIFLTQLKAQFPEVEIVALAFEKDTNFEISAKRVRKVKNKLKANYTFLLAGSHHKESAAKALPMLNDIISFPTTILINKNGEIEQIHTGFSGPGTGEEYYKFSEKYILSIKKLLNQ